MQYQKPVLVQEQKLRMSPQLYQSIQLMALPLHELKLQIQEEIEKNPALEVLDEKPDESIDEQPERDLEVEEYFENSSDPGYSRRLDQEASDSKQQFLEGALTHPESLQDHLQWQLRLQPIPSDWVELGELLIQNLDGDGFHREPPETFIPSEYEDALPEVLALIRQFEPVGTCVADYKESLRVQASLDPNAPDGVVTILSKYLELLERNKTAEIAKKMKVEEDAVLQILEYIRTLNPFPGREYSTESPRYVLPDLQVTMRDGEFVLILNDEEIPVLGLNPFFEGLLKDKEKSGTGKREVKKFVNASVKDARWFIRSIKQRNETLLKIAKAIIEFQREFFLRGPKYLVPLTLKDIANAVDVHETTVSRITTAKYVQTEWGIFELKHFFSNSISGAGSGGSRYSKEAVKEIIREIIEEDLAADSSNHLSDQKISDILKKRGINLARRTVAKYRRELKILSSYDR